MPQLWKDRSPEQKARHRKRCIAYIKRRVAIDPEFKERRQRQARKAYLKWKKKHGKK